MFALPRLLITFCVLAVSAAGVAPTVGGKFAFSEQPQTWGLVLAEADEPILDTERLLDAEQEEAREQREKARKEQILERENVEREQRAGEAQRRKTERDARLKQLIDR